MGKEPQVSKLATRDCQITKAEALALTHLYYQALGPAQRLEAEKQAMFRRYKVDPKKYGLNLDKGEFELIPVPPPAPAPEKK